MKLPVKDKNFTWSPSALKSYYTCPVQYWANYWDPNAVKQPQTDAMIWGTVVHKAFEDAVRNGDKKLPTRFAQYQKWLDSVHALPGEKQAEQKFGFDRLWNPVAFFDYKVWCRLIIDLTVNKEESCTVLDYKTGKSRYDNEDQLMLGMMAAKTEHEVPMYSAGYIYLKEDHSTYLQASADEVDGYKRYFENKVKPLVDSVSTGIFEPSPGGLCKKWCNVTRCPHNGGH